MVLGIMNNDRLGSPFGIQSNDIYVTYDTSAQ